MASTYVGTGCPSGTLWGSIFGEFSHLGAIATSMYPSRHTRGVGMSESTDPEVEGSAGPIRHQAVDLTTLSLTTPPWKKNSKAMRIAVPSSAGHTLRYQLASFYKTAKDGDDYWQSYGILIGDDWKTDTSGNFLQVKNDGFTFTNIGSGFRNISNGLNGPGGGVGDMSTRFGATHVVYQAHINLNGQTTQNGDGGLFPQTLIDNPRKGTWYHIMFHSKWSHGTGGLLEYFLNDTKIGEITGRNMQDSILSIEHRCGFYDGQNVDHPRTYYLSHHLIGLTRSSVDMYALNVGSVGGTPPVTPTGLSVVENPNGVTGSLILTSGTISDSQFSYYEIYRATGTTQPAIGDAAWVKNTTGGPSSNGRFPNPINFTDNTGFAAGTKVYYYAKEIQTDAEVSSASSVASVTISTPSGTPRDGIDTIQDDFNNVDRDTSLWPTTFGSPVQANGVAQFSPSSSATRQEIRTPASYQAEGKSIIAKLVAVPDVVSGTATAVEARGDLVADEAASNYITWKVVKTDADHVGQLYINSVLAGAIQGTSDPGIAYNSGTMVYFRFTVNSAGTSVTVATSPDKVTWTDRRTVSTGTWSFLNVSAKFSIGARQTGSGATSFASFDEVGDFAVVTPPTSGSVPLPASPLQKDLLLLFNAVGNPVANWSNMDDLPFTYFGFPQDGSHFYSDGVANATVRSWAGAKRYDSSTDTTAWPINFDASSEWAAEALIIRGADSLASDLGIMNVQTFTPAASTSFSLNVGSSPVAGARLYIFAACDTDASAGDWAVGAGGLTRIFLGKKTPEGIDIAGYAETIPTAGTAVTRTITHALSVAPVIVAFFARPGVVAA